MAGGATVDNEGELRGAVIADRREAGNAGDDSGFGALVSLDVGD